MKISLGAKTAIGVTVLVIALVASGLSTVELRENQSESRRSIKRSVRRPRLELEEYDGNFGQTPGGTAAADSSGSLL
jgi:hypothetical protein